MAKQIAARRPAARAPVRSTHGPHVAALKPSRTSALVNVGYGGVAHHGKLGSAAMMGRLSVLHA
jgi:hypothetical protein